MLHVVLFQPEIPHNTGAVGRLCLAAGARLHLIRPLGFSLADKHLKRAGLDYWHELDVRLWDSLDELKAQAAEQSKFFFFSTKAAKLFWNADFSTGDCYLIFGPETRGLPEPLLADESGSCFKIPMQPGARSLNLATAAGIALYEAVRQAGWDSAG